MTHSRREFLRLAPLAGVGLALDQNVYEGCLRSAVAPLSEASVVAGGMPRAFPDFTRGDWKTTAPLGIVS